MSIENSVVTYRVKYFNLLVKMALWFLVPLVLFLTEHPGGAWISVIVFLLLNVFVSWLVYKNPIQIAQTFAILTMLTTATTFVIFLKVYPTFLSWVTIMICVYCQFLGVVRIAVRYPKQKVTMSTEAKAYLLEKLNDHLTLESFLRIAIYGVTKMELNPMDMALLHEISGTKAIHSREWRIVYDGGNQSGDYLSIKGALMIISFKGKVT